MAMTCCRRTKRDADRDAEPIDVAISLRSIGGVATDVSRLRASDMNVPSRERAPLVPAVSGLGPDAANGGMIRTV